MVMSALPPKAKVELVARFGCSPAAACGRSKSAAIKRFALATLDMADAQSFRRTGIGCGAAMLLTYACGFAAYNINSGTRKRSTVAVNVFDDRSLVSDYERFARSFAQIRAGYSSPG